MKDEKWINIVEIRVFVFIFSMKVCRHKHFLQPIVLQYQRLNLSSPSFIRISTFLLHTFRSICVRQFISHTNQQMHIKVDLISVSSVVYFLLAMLVTLLPPQIMSTAQWKLLGKIIFFSFNIRKGVCKFAKPICLLYAMLTSKTAADGEGKCECCCLEVYISSKSDCFGNGDP